MRSIGSRGEFYLVLPNARPIFIGRFYEVRNVFMHEERPGKVEKAARGNLHIHLILKYSQVLICILKKEEEKCFEMGFFV